MRVKIFYPFLFLFIFILIISAQAQNKEHIFKNYSVNEDLSHNWVKAITQDKDGFIWIGTYDGLNRFDGNSFEVFKSDAHNPLTIRNNNIEALCTDIDGQIWIGYSGGLSTYNNNMGYFTHYSQNPDLKNSLVGNEVVDIKSDREGNIWIATSNSGISILNKKSGNFTNLKYNPDDLSSLASNNIYDIALDKDGNAWIVTQDKGLEFYNAKRKKFKHYGLGYNSSMNKIENIRKIYVDSKNNIWIVTWNQGLFIFDPLTSSVYRPDNIPGNIYFIDLIENSNGDIWLCSENKGIYIYNLERKSIFNITHNPFNKYALGHNSITEIFIDDNKNLWLGTYAGGVSYYSHQNNIFGYYFNIPGNAKSLSNNSVLCIEKSKETLFIGTDGGGLNTLNLNTGEINTIKSTLPGITMDVVISLFNEDDKYLWIGLYREGLLRYNIQTGQIENFTPKLNLKFLDNNYSFSSIILDHQKNLWLCTWGNGIHHFDFAKSQVTSFNKCLSSEVVVHIMEDSENKIWVSTTNGLDQLKDFQNKKFSRKYNEISKLEIHSTDMIQMTFEDSKGFIWVCTSNGLQCIDKAHKSIKTYTTNDGLPNNFINGITEDKNGNLWISTNGGLSLFDRIRQIFKNYNHLDGLQGNLYNRNSVCNISDKNLIAFGGTNGMNLFNPYTIHILNHVPEVQITRLWVDDKKVTPLSHKNILTTDINNANEIQLDYDVNKLKIDFVGVNHSNSYKNSYAYYLSGFDKTWSYTDKLSLTYTNLDPGDYLLHLKVSNDGNWNKKIKTLSIKINDPFWKKWWFILIEAVLFGLLWFLSLYSKTTNTKKYISRFLTIFTLIATLELITTIVENIVNLQVNPVYAFLINFSTAMFLLPLENILRRWIEKYKIKKLRRVAVGASTKS